MQKSSLRAYRPRLASPAGQVPAACALGLISLLGSSALAQQAGSSATAPRKLAPGVMVTIEPEIEPEETVSTHDIVELRTNADLEWDPELLASSRTLYGMSQDVKFRREIWCLEFSFKPVRMMEVDLPQPGGEVQRERIWYMVYRVTNRGTTLMPVEQEDSDNMVLQPGDGEPVRFIPQFVLEAQDRDAAGNKIYKAYLDRVIPAALEQIREREMPGGKLLGSAEMSEVLLPVSEGRVQRGVWGVATWQDIDPRIDFFSVYVSGLTNAYRWIDPPGAYQPNQPPGKGRRFARKTLQLNFWRPGDEHMQHETEIRHGVPQGKSGLYDVGEGVAHRWVYR